MTWIERVLAEHPEICLDDEGDRTALELHLCAALPTLEMLDVLRRNGCPTPEIALSQLFDLLVPKPTK